MSIPKKIFIIPYRDREMQQKFFDRHMKTFILANEIDYKIYYIHQKDDRPFNRGAMKNIGFLAMQEKYAEHYKDIIFIFNDVDTSPLCENIFDYSTVDNEVKHFYGFTHALGGIFAIKGKDFEKTNGFPNYWSWGYEDSVMLKRVTEQNLLINRDQFLPILHKNVLLLHDDIYRLVNRKEFNRFSKNISNDGINDISNLEKVIDEETGFIDVSNFTTSYLYDSSQDKVLDLREGGIPFVDNPSRFGGTMNMKFTD